MCLASALLLWATLGQTEPMHFNLTGNGGNCEGCGWLAADGEITADSAKQMTDYLRTLGFPDWRGNVLFNSPGGDLFGGIRLGQSIRDRGMSTQVGKSTSDGYGFEKVEKGQCASACVFAFLGGVDRTAGDGELGIHQFYNQAALADPTAKLFNAVDLSNQQLVSAVVLDYAVRMGAEPALIAQASSVPPAHVVWLSASEATALKASWHPGEFEPWGIEPYGNGVVAFSKTRDRKQTATVFCRNDQIPRLLLTLDAPGDPSDYLNLWSLVRGASVFGNAVPRSDMTLKVSKGKALWEIALRTFNSKAIRSDQLSMVSTGDYAPHVAWRYFYATLTADSLTQMARIALRNCI